MLMYLSTEDLDAVEIPLYKTNVIADGRALITIQLLPVDND